MNSGVYGQVWGALVRRNEDIPLAYYDFVAGSTLHCMYQQHCLPGSKGYLVHTGYIPSCGINSGVYGQVWGALVPRNEGGTLADYDLMAV